MQEGTQLHKDGFITEQELFAITTFQAEKPLSLHWELRTILYLGLLLLSSGVGILIYLNIETIGHQAILAMIAVTCIGCFYYAWKKRSPYSNETVKHPSPFFDYIVLLGCLLFGIFIAYLQVQYTAFGFHYGLATLLPTVLFFACAYLFDHKGVLSLGITGLSAWVGLAVTPLQLLEQNNFSDNTITFTALALGILLAGFAWYSDIKNIKRHFGFSFNNFAANILFIATLYLLFDAPWKIFSFLFLAFLCYYFIRYAIAQQSFLFLLLSVVYGYIGLTYCIFSAIGEFGDTAILFGSFYVFASCGGVVSFFLYYKKILGIKK